VGVRHQYWKSASIAAFLIGLAACAQKPAPSKAEAPAAVSRSTPAPVAARKPAPARGGAPTSHARVTPRTKAAPTAPVEAVPTGGTLRIDSDVPGAQVFIDRQYVGATPLTAPNISTGTHQLNISAQGYNGIVQSIDVEPGPRDLVFKFKEVRLEASIDVVHKHRIGSCKGRLLATPQGLRYDTADKNDGFNVPLASLERFDVDYLAKALHVGLAKGRQFDFTDPESNADRLFVFHRDVDAARKKLGDKQ
jgi:hypothetical protein